VPPALPGRETEGSEGEVPSQALTTTSNGYLPESKGEDAAAPLNPISSRKLKKLWSLVRAYGAGIHAGPVKADGLAAWQPLKEILSNAEGLSQWTDARTGDAKTDAVILKTFEGYEAGNNGAVSAEDAHYFAQLFRLPAREECSLRRLLQVAYNSGQLSASGALTRLGEAAEAWPELYRAHRLGRLGTYCADGSPFRVPADLIEAVRALAQSRK
jgi:hypothetical protein